MTYPDQDQFSHRKSKYDRPTLNYRCGRGQMWGKPCEQGPDAGGTCRGVAECRPVKKDDRWQCRRPSGACEQGPMPDGSCCNTQPPCSPVPSTRLYRRRAVIFTLVLASAILCSLLVYSELNSVAPQSDGLDQTNQGFDAAGVSILSPGDLSDLHSVFTQDEGCEACHIPEQAHEGTSFLAAGIGLASLRDHQSLSTGCVSCHTFDGPALTAHNAADSSDKLECRSCHTDHQGRFANLTKISDQQCAACHEQDFSSFKNHPAFADNFPYLEAGNIVFDHRKHLEFHFEKTKDPDLVPATCTSCHMPKAAASNVPISGFEPSCGGCHESNINDSGKADLELLALPAIKLKGADEVALYKECGANDDNRFRSAGKSRSNPFTDWLLGYRLKDSKEYAAAFCDLLQVLDAKGLAGLLAKFEKRSGMDGEELFNGLTPELIGVLTADWIQDERYRPSSKKMPKGFSPTGWSVNKKGELNYRPTGHSDKVALNWLEFAAQLRVSKSEDKLAMRLADSVLDADGGLGACMKCHLPTSFATKSATANDVEAGFVLWSREVKQPAHRFKFDHSAHLRFVGAGNAGLDETGVGCALCHELNPDSDYLDSIRSGTADVAYESNFHSLKKETCSQCHNEQSIKDDCTLCHVYHESPGFTPKLNMSLGANR